MECSVPTTVSIASWAKGFILRLVLKPTNFSFCWRFFLDKRAPQHIRKKNKMWCNTAEFRTSWEQKFYLLLGGTCISWSILDLRLPFSTIHLKVFDSIKFRNNSQNKFSFKLKRHLSKSQNQHFWKRMMEKKHWRTRQTTWRWWRASRIGIN